MKIKRLDHVGVVVADLERASRLLQETFGLDVQDRIDRQDLSAVFFSCGSARIELIELSDPAARQARLGDGAARIEHIAFEIEGLDAVLRELTGQGVRPTEPPRQTAGGRTFWTEPSTTGGVMYQFLER